MAIEQPKRLPAPKHHPDAIVTTHPAYGQISIGRTTGNVTLYGSDLNHHHCIHITINRSKMERSLSADKHFAEEELVDVYLSENDWATLLSSMNVGGGVPCTLRTVAGKSMPQLPKPVDRREQFRTEADETCKDAYKHLQNLQDSLSDLNMPAKARKEIESHLRRAIQELQANLPFVLSQFAEHMDDTVAAGKQELLAYAKTHNLLDGLRQLTQKAREDADE